MNYVLAVVISTILLKRSLVCSKKRIIGGRTAKIEDYPYQLSLILKRSANLNFTDFKGAAVIVSDRWALTSANNIAFIDPQLFKAGLVYLRGNVAKWNAKRGYLDHQIVHTYLHHKYETFSRDYNLALVKIKNRFHGNNEKAINVAGKSYKYEDGLTVTIVGWGKLSIGQIGPTTDLRVANLKLMNQNQCNDMYSKGYVSPLTPRMICSDNSGHDACVYDSGGPMIHRQGKKVLLLDVLADEISRNPRIFGGSTVNIKDVPYQVSIIAKPNQYTKPTFIDGAVIISLYWAITAAQCVHSSKIKTVDIKQIYIRGNTSYWKGDHFVDHKIILRRIHPHYNKQTHDYDIALLRVFKPFLGKFEKPIMVAATAYELEEDAKVSISGWGTTSNRERDPQDRLRAADLRIVASDECKDLYAYAGVGKVTNRMICAWNYRKDSCIYDNGGPMVHNGVLIGLVSWGARCGSPVYPGVYTKLPAFESWLRQEQRSQATLQISFKYTKQKPISNRKYLHITECSKNC